MELLLIVPIGGGGAIALLFFFMAMLATEDFCVAAMSFLAENAVAIGIVLGIISLVVAIMATVYTQKIIWGVSIFVLVMHFLCCSTYGIYGTIETADKSFFLLILGGVIYFAVTLVHAIISIALALFCAEKNKPIIIWPVSILISLFLFTFY